jgi:hypothetical protein
VDLSKIGNDPVEMAKALSLTDISDQTRAAIAGATPPVMMAGLMLGSPEFQRK